MKASEISAVVKCVDSTLPSPDREVGVLLTDSRKLTKSEASLFFAIPTKHNSGARYVDALYKEGVRNFVVPKDFSAVYADANMWKVEDVVAAMQQVAAAHRSHFSIPVVGITGSNGKTIVKEWLVQMLAADRRVVSSPKSFNSQIGVPLSVWQMSDADEMAVFEAGISESGEMVRLQRVIQPTIGIFTNIGQAHDENFLARSQKVAEKLQLFTHCEVIVYCSDHKEIHSMIADIDSLRQLKRYTWGAGSDNAVQLLSADVADHSTVLHVRHDGDEVSLTIPFADRSSVENAMHCITTLFYLGVPADEIVRRAARLEPVEMRLEMSEGINNCLLINDSYSLDFNSLSIALDFLQHERQHFRKTLVLSDIMQTGIPSDELYAQVAQLIAQRGVTRLIAIGEALCHCRNSFSGIESEFFASTDAFVSTYDFGSFHDETILLKGARVFRFENIAKLLLRKTHETVMEVDLSALVHNLNHYRARLRPTTKLMAMVKASGYGAGKVEVASTLQYNHADYLTVAYADEGVELRRNGITLPIMVMNPEEAAFADIVKYNLEPDIYSFRILDLFAHYVSLCGAGPVAVHVELDTGMHRLGFMEPDLDALPSKLKSLAGLLEVRSIFSHLACSEDPADDEFTHAQINHFREWSNRLRTELGDPSILVHILNSSGITRFPEAQFDMVRLGIGLYGIAPEPEVQGRLKQVSRLVARISQVKEIPAGDSVSYNRRFVAQRPTRIAVLPLGYADGLNRRLGYGRGRVSIAGHEAPIVGSVCMDMCFADVTGIPCREGDEVLFFGVGDLLQRNAAAAETIPYELLTSVSPRVKRVYRSE